jgi:hypothetical protein
VKKIMGIVALVVGLFYGVVQVRLESPLFQSQIDGFMKEMSDLSRFTVAESVDSPYNFVKSEVIPNVKQNFTTYLMVGMIFTSTLILRRRGKTTTQALRSAVLHVPDQPQTEHPVVVRARNKTIRMQLLSDQIGVQKRLKVLPERIIATQKEVAYVEKAHQEATANLKKATEALSVVTEQLESLESEKARLNLEFVHIQDELDKLEVA